MKSKPEWLKIKYDGKKMLEVNNKLRDLHLHSVCEEANCPNRAECFGKKTATFMILGRNCTRNCKFCNVEKENPTPIDPKEPANIAQAVKDMDMKHVVITSVTRDDLDDGGASHFAKVIEEVHAVGQDITVEVLIPDLQGNIDALKEIIAAKPEIINHNLETINKLYETVRPMANYKQSLNLLKNVKSIDSSIGTKSGIMLGLGEEYEEVLKLMKDLVEVKCDILTIGQYLAPSTKHHPVIEYIHPDLFQQYKEDGLKLGFKYVASSPLVRSSYNAYEAMENIKILRGL